MHTYSKGRMLLELLSVRSGLSNLTSETICNDLETFIDFNEPQCSCLYCIIVIHDVFKLFLGVCTVLRVRFYSKYNNIQCACDWNWTLTIHAPNLNRQTQSKPYHFLGCLGVRLPQHPTIFRPKWHISVSRKLLSPADFEDKYAANLISTAVLQTRWVAHHC